MTRQFQYSPGLPGYGTRGVDGSAGLTGVATWFSSYDGASDSVTIKSKIIANKELFSNDDLIPGYPDRLYQSGDIFIDRNARIYQIDFGESNLYKDTGVFLNTSGFFTSGPPQTLSPEFQRYSNQFELEKYLIDTVYTNSVGDYTTYPTSIYDNKPLYYANVKYIGQDLLPDFTNYYPFQVWTIGSTDDNDSIALARSLTENVWRFGNFDSGSIGDASLYLDFPDVYGETFHGDFDGNFSGSITATNLHLPGWLRVDGDVSTGSDLYVGDDLYVQGHLLKFPSGAANYITADQWLVIRTPDEINSSFSERVSLATGSLSGGSGGNAGYISMRGGHGGPSSIGAGGTGGDIIMDTGNGGDSTANNGGRGGYYDIDAGPGGDSDDNWAGAGGYFDIDAGNGGDAIDLGDGGNGGYMDIKLGDGGDSPEEDAGNGGYYVLRGGEGGTGADAGSTGGDGGAISIYGGKAGNGDTEGYGGNVFLHAGSDRANSWTGTRNGDVYLGSTATGLDRGQAFFSNGAASRPSISFAADQNTGFFRDAADEMKMTLGGTAKIKYYTSGTLLQEFQQRSKITTTGSNHLDIQAGPGGGNLYLITAGGGDINLIPGTGSLVLNNIPSTVGTEYLEISAGVVSRNGSPSDIKYKDLQGPIEGALDKVLSLAGYRFKWNQTSKELFDDVDHDAIQIGVVAQELEKVMPELVAEVKMEDKGISYKQVKYNRLAPLLIEAIKEQDTKIEDLKKIIETQQKQINQILNK